MTVIFEHRGRANKREAERARENKRKKGRRRDVSGRERLAVSNHCGLQIINLRARECGWGGKKRSGLKKKKEQQKGEWLDAWGVERHNSFALALVWEFVTLSLFPWFSSTRPDVIIPLLFNLEWFALKWDERGDENGNQDGQTQS